MDSEDTTCTENGLKFLIDYHRKKGQSETAGALCELLKLREEKINTVKLYTDSCQELGNVLRDNRVLREALIKLGKREPGDFCDCDIIARNALKQTKALTPAEEVCGCMVTGDENCNFCKPPHKPIKEV